VIERVQRLHAAWRRLEGDERFAGLSALALLLTMVLPWYEKSVVVRGSASFAKDSISAFGAVSFVEAAIFLVAAGVLALVLARGEGRRFHLPGGDGTVIFAAGLWATLLIFYRVFDRPDVSGEGGTVGIQWGFFVAFVAAGALTAAGWRLRAAAAPGPPVVDEGSERTTVVAPDRAPTTVARTRRPTDRAVTREDARQLTFDEPPREPLEPGEIPPAPDR
jgi:hypothetical protein